MGEQIPGQEGQDPLEQKALRGERIKLINELIKLDRRLPPGSNFIVGSGYSASKDDGAQRLTSDGKFVTITGRTSVSDDRDNPRYSHNFFTIDADRETANQFTLVTNSPDNPYLEFQRYPYLRIEQGLDKIVISSLESGKILAESPIVRRIPISTDDSSPLKDMIQSAYETAKIRGKQMPTLTIKIKVDKIIGVINFVRGLFDSKHPPVSGS